MHTADAVLRRTVFNHERINLESHQLIWLDSNVYDVSHDDTAVTLKNLRKIIDYTKLYNNSEESIQYIKQTSNTVTFLVCSGRLGQQIVPIVHQMKHIWTIYIYCQNKSYHKLWAAEYPKVNSINLQKGIP
jgi:hypothetical protein